VPELVQLPFYVGAFAVLLSVGALASGWKPLAHLRTPEAYSEAEATALS
jgi:MFS transporter, ACDE family, multidrug resistance protein